MNKASIIRTAEDIVSTYGTRDPDSICREEGIILLYSQMGTEEEACKGFILGFNGRTAITVNSDLGESMQHIIKLHELSHYFLHVKTGIAEAFHDFTSFSEADIEEYEANLLASELLLTDQEVSELLDEGCGFYDCASRLSVPPEILDFKLRLLREKGKTSAEAPISATGSFLRRIS